MMNHTAYKEILPKPPKEPLMSLSRLADSNIYITLEHIHANSAMPSLEDLGPIITKFHSSINTKTERSYDLYGRTLFLDTPLEDKLTERGNEYEQIWTPYKYTR